MTIKTRLRMKITETTIWYKEKDRNEETEAEQELIKEERGNKK